MRWLKEVFTRHRDKEDLVPVECYDDAGLLINKALVKLKTIPEFSRAFTEAMLGNNASSTKNKFHIDFTTEKNKYRIDYHLRPYLAVSQKQFFSLIAFDPNSDLEEQTIAWAIIADSKFQERKNGKVVMVESVHVHDYLDDTHLWSAVVKDGKKYYRRPQLDNMNAAVFKAHELLDRLPVSSY